ncbi:hypothetical protein HN51_055240 [Arachis hypogaea]
MQKAKEKNLKGSREKQQFSTESSITSICVHYLHISGTISAYESLTLRGYDVVAVVLEDHGLLNEGRIMSYMWNNMISTYILLFTSSCMLPVLVLPPVPKGMPQLSELEISQCNLMKKVVFEDDDASTMNDETGETIQFPLLHSLSLQHLDALECFYSHQPTSSPIFLFNNQCASVILFRVVFSCNRVLKS